MKLQMQLSKFTVLVLRELKANYEKESEGVLTYQYGGVIKKAWYSISDKKIDWEKLNESTLSYVFEDKEAVSKATVFSTTLNLSTEVNQAILDLQEVFKSTFEAARIYKPFVVKLIVFAGLMQAKGQISNFVLPE